VRQAPPRLRLVIGLEQAHLTILPAVANHLRAAQRGEGAFVRIHSTSPHATGPQPLGWRLPPLHARSRNSQRAQWASQSPRGPAPAEILDLLRKTRRQIRLLRRAAHLHCGVHGKGPHAAHVCAAPSHAEHRLLVCGDGGGAHA
jgi:hypothetical protein